jgi:FkbM family methyltransferase
MLQINSPSYLDVGAHHATFLSNTFYFYERGSRGVCIEPDPALYSKLRLARKRDTCLNVGIGVDEKQVADFYIMSPSTLNTFSKIEAERYVNASGHKIEAVIPVALKSINEILETYFDKTPNFVSLDTEGLDLAILMSLDFSAYRPEAFCIETIDYPDGKRATGIFDLMHEKDYLIYGDTGINTIFVDKFIWPKSSLSRLLFR